MVSTAMPVALEAIDRHLHAGVPDPVVEVRRLTVVVGPGCPMCPDARGRRCVACATTWALEDVSFDVLPGEVVGVLGGPGAGKTTLLQAVAGGHVPAEGEIRMGAGGVLVLTPESLATGVRLGRVSDAELARRLVATVTVPDLLVVDDPTVGQDASLQATLVDLLHRLASAGPWALLVASSDPRVLRTLADRVLVLREGRAVVLGLTEALLGTGGTVPW